MVYERETKDCARSWTFQHRFAPLKVVGFHSHSPVNLRLLFEIIQLAVQQNCVICCTKNPPVTFLFQCRAKVFFCQPILVKIMTDREFCVRLSTIGTTPVSCPDWFIALFSFLNLENKIFQVVGMDGIHSILSSLLRSLLRFCTNLGY